MGLRITPDEKSADEPCMDAQESRHTEGSPVGAISPEQARALVDGQHRARKVRRAAVVAAVSGWSMVVFAAVSVLAGCFGDAASVVAGVLLGAVAVNELRGGAMLRRLEMRGPRVLAWNQAMLGVLIVGYAAWSLVAARSSPALAALGARGGTGDPEVDAMVAQVARVATYGVYGSLMVVGVIVPGVTAWYYASRRKHIEAMVRKTPGWVVEAVRAAA